MKALVEGGGDDGEWVLCKRHWLPGNLVPRTLVQEYNGDSFSAELKDLITLASSFKEKEEDLDEKAQNPPMSKF